MRRLDQFQCFQSTELLESEQRKKELKLTRCVVHVRQRQRNDLLGLDVMQSEVEVRHAERLRVQPVSIVRVQDVVETSADVVEREKDLVRLEMVQNGVNQFHGEFIETHIGLNRRHLLKAHVQE